MKRVHIAVAVAVAEQGGKKLQSVDNNTYILI